MIINSRQVFGGHSRVYFSHLQRNLSANSQIVSCQTCNYSSATKKTSNPDAHNPSEIQFKWYSLWQKKLKQFNGENERKKFSMLFPPPNVTGNLHLGHAITATIQDSIVRWKLMKNHRVHWIPGFDHAGIATQVVVEKKIWNESKSTRHSLGKQKFINEVFKWKDEKSTTIREQMVKLNALVDWDYEYFTMDKNICHSVNEAFIRLYEQGIIHRAMRPINWCCSLKSAISDAEVDVTTINKKTSLTIPNYVKPIDFGLLYELAYPINESDEKIVVATTRPETMFGDTAIAVNPLDKRYAKLRGKSAVNPLTQELIPIIVDDNVDPKFGTGAVKITPCHDMNDYETGHRHKLKFKQILNDDGCLTNVPDRYMNMPRFEARKKVVSELQSLNLLVNVKEHEMSLPLCSRTGDVIEPMLKEQWFVNSSKLFKICQKCVTDGSLKLIPGNRVNLWNNYVHMFTKRDWCISRQLWWGQQIPAYLCWPRHEPNNQKWFVGHELKDVIEQARKHFKSDDICLKQDEDVFDTWFTSTLLPLAVLGWPNQLNNQLYPTNMLETGFDIMYFWAFRMVGMCHALSGQLPYEEIMFHGLIRDAQGRKMSKSIGNVIDPIDLIDGATIDELNKRVLDSNLSNREKSLSVRNQQKLYPNGIDSVGSDAMRLALLVQDFRCDSVNIDMNLFKDAKRYCNKIWQAIRYFQMCVDADTKNSFKLLTLNQVIEDGKNVRLIDTWLLNRFLETIKIVETNFENEYSFHTVIKALREFYYQDFCDFYLESTKPVLKQLTTSDDDVKLKQNVWNILRLCNRYTLLLYHPFMPSITEELWQKYEIKCDQKSSFVSILDSKYPSIDDFSKIDDKIDIKFINEVIKCAKSIISSVLFVKKTTSKKNKNPELIINCKDQLYESELNKLKHEIGHLTKINDVKFETSSLKPITNGREIQINDFTNIIFKF